MDLLLTVHFLRREGEPIGPCTIHSLSTHPSLWPVFHRRTRGCFSFLFFILYSLFLFNCYLLSIIYYLSSIIYYLLFIIYYLLSIIYYLLSIIYYLLSIIYYLLSIIYYLLSIIYYLLFIIYYFYFYLYFTLLLLICYVRELCQMVCYWRRIGTQALTLNSNEPCNHLDQNQEQVFPSLSLSLSLLMSPHLHSLSLSSSLSNLHVIYFSHLWIPSFWYHSTSHDHAVVRFQIGHEARRPGLRSSLG